jgi:hypothetical protein
MTEHLWPLLRLQAANDKELIEAYRQVFVETYVRTSDGKAIEVFDWLGNKVIFNPRNFDHAFSESTDYRSAAASMMFPFLKSGLVVSSGSRRSLQHRKEALNEGKHTAGTAVSGGRSVGY